MLTLWRLATFGDFQKKQQCALQSNMIAKGVTRLDGTQSKLV